MMRPNAAAEPGCPKQDEQNSSSGSSNAGRGRLARTGQGNQVSDSSEGTAASTPSVGGTSSSTLDAVACAAEQANPANIYDLDRLWAPKGEKTSRDCGHFGEAV